MTAYRECISKVVTESYQEAKAPLDKEMLKLIPLRRRMLLTQSIRGEGPFLATSSALPLPRVNKFPLATSDAPSEQSSVSPSSPSTVCIGFSGDIDWNPKEDLPANECTSFAKIKVKGESKEVNVSSELWDSQLREGKFDYTGMPPTDEWNRIKKYQELQTEGSHNENIIRLPSGKEISYKEFSENPLFKHTIEKHEVHGRCAKLLTIPEFITAYTQFKEDLKGDDWAEGYREKPRLLAYLSLVAYLDGNISQEELVTVHTVATALMHSDTSYSEITVLNEDNAPSYLYAKKCLSSSASYSKTSSWRHNFSGKSAIERTAVLFKPRWEVGNTFGKIGSELEPKSLILSPKLQMEVFHDTYSQHNGREEDPSQNLHLMFGYDQTDSSLFSKENRALSYCSPLLRSPRVHGGIFGLDVTVHDRHHIEMDWKHPFAGILCDLGEKMLSEAPKPLRRLAWDILDREQIKGTYEAQDSTNNGPSKKDWVQAFWETITHNFQNKFPDTVENREFAEKVLIPFFIERARNYCTVQIIDKAMGSYEFWLLDILKTHIDPEE